jgi:hypothetical protein
MFSGGGGRGRGRGKEARESSRCERECSQRLPIAARLQRKRAREKKHQNSRSGLRRMQRRGICFRRKIIQPLLNKDTARAIKKLIILALRYFSAAAAGDAMTLVHTEFEPDCASNPSSYLPRPREEAELLPTVTSIYHAPSIITDATSPRPSLKSSWRSETARGSARSHTPSQLGKSHKVPRPPGLAV